MKDDMNKRLKVWQMITLVQIVMIFFLGLYATYQRTAFAAQLSYLANLETTLKDKEAKEKELSSRLLTVMALLQRAVNELNQEGQEMGINNIVPSSTGK